MLELYNFAESTCSQKVSLCLAEKQLDFIDYRVDYAKREQLAPWYLKLNPNGVVPTLVHDGRPVIESSVIVEYLDDVFPTPALAPEHPLDRAAMRAWLRFIDEVPTSAVRIPSLNMTLLPLFARMPEPDYQDYLQRTPLRKHFMQRMGRSGFTRQDYNEAIEKLMTTVRRMALALEEGPWLLGSEFTLADICLLPTVDRLNDLGLSKLWENEFPSVGRWYERARSRPSFSKTFFPGTRLSERYKVAKWNAMIDA
jgi:glutathione S-transferase